MPPQVLPEAQSQHEAAQAHRQEERAQGVKALLFPPEDQPRRQEAQGGQDPDNPQRHVDIKNPAPAEGLGDDAAHGRASARPRRHYQAQNTHGPPPLAARKGPGDHGGADGHEHGAAHPLQGPEQHQGHERRGHAAEDGAQGEHGEARRPQEFLPHQVGDAPQDQQQAADDDEVGDNHPFHQPVHGGMERLADLGERNVDDAGIQGRHEDAQSHQPHDRPFARRLLAGLGVGSGASAIFLFRCSHLRRLNPAAIFTNQLLTIV